MDTLDCIYVDNFKTDKCFKPILKSLIGNPKVLVHEDHLDDYCDYYNLDINCFNKQVQIYETAFYYR